MSDFRLLPGFEDIWRAPVTLKPCKPETVLRPLTKAELRARLQRIARRVPEVMVKITGRTRDPAHLASHLTYISRNGDLPLEGRDAVSMEGRGEVIELARDWAATAMADSRRRVNSPLSVGIILSMPAGTDAIRLRDAVRAFATEELADRFDYVMALHLDQGHPHVHLTVCALGEGGARLNPKKADLERWRQTFARALRERGVEAEATPRRARGVTRKSERAPVRRLRERHEEGRGKMSRIAQDKLRESARLAFGGKVRALAWEVRTMKRQARVRRIYLAQARLLQSSSEEGDRALGREVEAFVRSMQPPDTERLALARSLRDANERARQGRSHSVARARIDRKWRKVDMAS